MSNNILFKFTNKKKVKTSKFKPIDRQIMSNFTNKNQITVYFKQY